MLETLLEMNITTIVPLSFQNSLGEFIYLFILKKIHFNLTITNFLKVQKKKTHIILLQIGTYVFM